MTKNKLHIAGPRNRAKVKAFLRHLQDFLESEGVEKLIVDQPPSDDGHRVIVEVVFTDDTVLNGVYQKCIIDLPQIDLLVGSGEEVR